MFGWGCRVTNYVAPEVYARRQKRIRRKNAKHGVVLLVETLKASSRLKISYLMAPTACVPFGHPIRS